MSDVGDLIARFRRAVLARESEASRQIAAAYGRAWQVVQAEMRRFYDLLDQEARRTGLTIAEVAQANPSWPFRAGNLRAVSERIALELRAVVMEAQLSVMEAQSAGVRLGLQHAEELIRQDIAAGLRGQLSRETLAVLQGVWNQPNLGALQSLVGLLADGSPLDSIFREYGLSAAKRLAETLLRGFTLGVGPRQAAAWLQADLGGNLSRALTIARTEIIRAYRQAKTASFEANRDLVTGWVWICELGPDSCIGCIEQHGSVHPPDETLEDHPNGKCAQQPQTPTYADLAKRLGIPELAGIPEPVSPVQAGEQWFNRQPLSVQAGILNPKALDLYRSGKVAFSDLVATRTDRVWGRAIGPAPLRELQRLAG